MKKSRTFRKSFVAAIAALCLAAPLAVMPVQVETSYADGEATAQTTYKAYQIFKGTLANDSLGNIEWGADVSLTTDEEAALLDALKNVSNDFKDCTTAKSIAEVLSVKGADAAKIFASVVEEYIDGTGDPMTVNQPSSVGNGAGYYLVKTESGGDAKTRYILEVTGDTIEINPKTATPTVVKKVQENTNITESYGSYTNYNDVADYNIGDSVPFLLEASLSENNEGFSEYSAYYLKFNDTLSKGFVAPSADDISIYVVNNTTEIPVKANPYNIHKDITPGSDGPTQIAITIEDINKLVNANTDGDISVTASSKIVVKYNAVLDVDATIGLGGNENSVNLEYSNNPNVSYNPTTDGPKDNTEGDKDDENDTVDENETTPETPDVTDDNPDDGDTSEDNTGKTEDDKVIVFTYELDVLKQLADSAEADGYKNADNGEVGFKLYRMNGGTKEYAKITDGKISGWTEIEKDGTEVTTQGSHVIFTGLDDGTYWLKETTTPAGYNSIADYQITIDATTDNVQNWNGTASSVLTNVDLKDAGGEYLDGSESNNDNTDGKLEMTINNEKGSSLPSTGGIGTTIFYLGGGTMAAVAGVYLITKKRMKNEEDDEI